MPETITLTVYTLDELDPAVQQRVLERHYDINTDYEWWECVTDDFDRFGKASGLDCRYGKGFELDRGAYACLAPFHTTLADLEAHREAAQGEYPNDYSAVLAPFFAAFTPKEWRQLLRLERRECLDTLTGGTRTDCRRATAWSTVERYDDGAHPHVHALLTQLECAWERCVQDLEHALLTALREEYRYLTSEAAIREMITANEVRFFANGRVL